MRSFHSHHSTKLSYYYCKSVAFFVCRTVISERMTELGKTSVRIPRVYTSCVEYRMVRLSHFTSRFSCTICTFLHRFEAVPGAVDLSRVIQEEIRGHFADQEMAWPTSEEVGFLAFTTRPEVGKATSMLVYGSNVSQKMQDTIISRKYPGHDHQRHTTPSLGPSQAARRVRTSEPISDVAELQATIQKLEQQLAQEEQISYELRQQLSNRVSDSPTTVSSIEAHHVCINDVTQVEDWRSQVGCERLREYRVY